jgi:alpha-glucuronidase
LRGKIDEERYRAVLGKLEYQAGYAIVWRDAICNWFEKTSHIEDAQGRAGHYPGRIEAESMSLDGYVVTDVTSWEAYRSYGDGRHPASPRRSRRGA